MKFSDLKTGMIVYDKWYPWENGIVTKILKTRVKIKFSNQGIITYDKSHVYFLEKEEEAK